MAKDPTTDKPLTALTILELTHLVSSQDDRWADLLTYAQSAHNPAAPAGIRFFKSTWRPVLGSYFENVVARYDSTAKAPAHIVTWLLDLMSNRVYPAARQVGFSDRSFLFPDITIEHSGHPASPPVVAVRGTDAPARGEPDIGTRIAYAGVGIIFLGMGVYALKARQLAKMPL